MFLEAVEIESLKLLRENKDVFITGSDINIYILKVDTEFLYHYSSKSSEGHRILADSLDAASCIKIDNDNLRVFSETEIHNINLNKFMFKENKPESLLKIDFQICSVIPNDIRERLVKYYMDYKKSFLSIK